MPSKQKKKAAEVASKNAIKKKQARLIEVSGVNIRVINCLIFI